MVYGSLYPCAFHSKSPTLDQDALFDLKMPGIREVKERFGEKFAGKSADK
jgi:hypothetical protein